MGNGKKKKNKKNPTNPQTSNYEDKKEVPNKIEQKKEVPSSSWREKPQSSTQGADSDVPAYGKKGYPDAKVQRKASESEKGSLDDDFKEKSQTNFAGRQKKPEGAIGRFRPIDTEEEFQKHSTNPQTSNNGDKKEVSSSSSKELSQSSKQGAGSDVPENWEEDYAYKEDQREGYEPEKDYSDYAFKEKNQKKFGRSQKKQEAASGQFRFIEVDGDLFDAPQEYALAHCVASDFKMGAGVAIEFRKQFASVGNLLDQNVGVGGVASINKKGRYVYYLVTKKLSSGKPTNHSLKASLVELCRQMRDHNVKKLAIPELGCGLDNLRWDEVKEMICKVFADSDVEIKVYHYRPNAAKRNYQRNQPSSEEQSSYIRGQMKITDHFRGDFFLRRNDNKNERSNRNPENDKKHRDTVSPNAPMKRLKLDSETTAHRSNCKIEIKTGNIFNAPSEYSWAFCITPDFDRSKESALKFRYPYGNIGTVLDQKITVGGVAYVEKKNRLIYYMVITFDKENPIYSTLQNSLMCLKDLMEKHKVNKFAMPCMDQLHRPEFTKMIKNIFASTNVQILIYTSEKYEKTSSAPPLSAYIVPSNKSLVDMEDQTARLYICSVTDDITEDMRLLDAKFPFLNEYKRTQRMLGDMVRVKTPRGLDYTYGLVCRKSPEDPVQFEMLEKCMRSFTKNNKIDEYMYLGIQDIEEGGNDIVMDQVLNVMKYSTRLPVKEIHVCKSHI